MKIVHIFRPAGDAEAGLWSLVEEGKRQDVLRDLFDSWLDPEQILVRDWLKKEGLITPKDLTDLS